MNIKEFEQSLKKVDTLLSKSFLLKDSKYKYKGISPTFYKIRSNKELADAYIKEVNDNNFSFLLKDESFFQFHFEKMENSKCKLRYIFFQFPYEFPTYEQFLKEVYNAEFSDAGYSCHEFYSQAASEADLKNHIAFLRYDYSEEDYKEGIHSASHIHLGFSKTMRLGIDKILSPEAFTLFILKQIYIPEWSSMVCNPKLRSNLRSFKRNCPSLMDSSLFNDLDRCELYFT